MTTLCEYHQWQEYNSSLPYFQVKSKWQRKIAEGFVVLLFPRKPVHMTSHKVCLKTQYNVEETVLYYVEHRKILAVWFSTPINVLAKVSADWVGLFLLGFINLICMFDRSLGFAYLHNLTREKSLLLRGFRNNPTASNCAVTLSSASWLWFIMTFHSTNSLVKLWGAVSH